MFMPIMQRAKRSSGSSPRSNWPTISGLSRRKLTAALALIRGHEDEIRRAWEAHFGR